MGFDCGVGKECWNEVKVNLVKNMWIYKGKIVENGRNPSTGKWWAKRTMDRKERGESERDHRENWESVVFNRGKCSRRQNIFIPPFPLKKNLYYYYFEGQRGLFPPYGIGRTKLFSICPSSPTRLSHRYTFVSHLSLSHRWLWSNEYPSRKITSRRICITHTCMVYSRMYYNEFFSMKRRGP